ncbi:MAG: APC family permease [Clostridiales bacterium]|nr:APC family permease [Clostridiales bacterium]
MKEKKLPLISLVALATGQVIGAGVITTTGLAIGQTGKSVFLAYALAVILGTMWIYPIMYFASMAKYKGGSYTVVTTTLGDLWGGIYAIWWVLMFLGTAMMGLSIAQYVNAIFPAIPKQAIALVAVVVIFVLNLQGVNLMASVQTFFTVFLVIALSIFVIVGLPQCSSTALDSTSFLMNGKEGFMGGLVLLVYSTSGHNLVAGYSYQAKNPKKNIPMAMIITTGIIMVLYVGISYVASHVLPIDQVAGQSLVNVSKEIFPTGIFYVFIVGGPIMALITTLNSSYSSITAPTVAAIDRGWLPAVLGKRNRHGVPYVVYTIMFLFSLIPILLGVSLTAITRYTVMGQRICMSLVCFCGFLYPTKFKEQWEKSWLHIPKCIYYPVVAICFGTQIYAVYLSGASLAPTVFIGNMIVLVVMACYAACRYKSGKTTAAIPVCTFDDEEELS